MKNILFLLILIASVFTSLNTNAQCYNATYGLWPSSTFTPNCNNAFANITTSGYASEYSRVNLIAGNTYTFRSSRSTDYITVDNNGAAPLVGVVGVSGTAGVSWTCTVTGTYRFYTHVSSSCGSSTLTRTRSVRCTVPPSGPSANCTNTTDFGSATINANGTAVTISTCSYAGEYSTISGAVSGQVLRFTSSAVGDYITIRSGSPTGAVVAQGSAPLQFTNTFTGTLYAHWNTATTCGTQSSCRTTTVQCMSCTAPPAVANDNCSGATLLSCGTTVTVNTTAATTDAAGSNFCGTTITTPGVWYRILGNGQNMTVSTVGLTSVDSKLIVFSGSCTGLTCVGGSDDFSGLQSQVSWSSVSGTTYYVLAATFSGTGSFPMSLNCVAPPPPYDPCANITNITSCGSSTNVNISAGNGNWSSFGGPFTTPGREQLFTFTPTVTASYPITVTNNGTGWIDLFVKTTASGCNNSSWTYIDDISGTATNNVTLTAGVTYYFLLDDEDSNGSTGSISLGCPCIGTPNDGTYTYSSAFSISGTTVGACDDSPLRASSDRIYAVNVGCAGSYTFSLCGGTTWDTYLYLTTAAGGGGTIVAFNDDACSLQSSLTASLNAGTYYIVVEGFSSTSEGAFTLNVSGTGSTPAITGNAANASCNGASNGSIDVTATSSNAVSYAWSNGATSQDLTGVAAGTYTLTATNCWGSSSANFTVGQPAAITSSVASDVANDAVCMGGGMTLTGSIGGDVTVTYHWEQYDDFAGWSAITNDVNVSAPATVSLDLIDLYASANYQLVVTSAADGSCSAAGEIAVTVVEDPTIAVTTANVSCNGGSNGAIEAVLSGGLDGMNYSWDFGPSVSGLSAGTYTMNATGTLGCDASASATITEPTVLTSASTSGTITCNGGTTTVSVSAAGGTAPYSGTGNFTVSAGTYSYTVTDANGCTSNTSITVSQPTALIATISSTAPNTTVCNGGTAPLTASVGGTGTVNYQWQFQNNNGNWVNVSGWSGTNVSLPFTNSRNASPSATRAYRIVVRRTNDANCEVIATQLVTVIADPVFTITSTNVSCFGANDGTATAVLTGGLPLNYEYNWFSNDGNSSNNNPTGDGTLSVTGLFPAEWVINTTVSGSNFGCYAQSSVFITQPTVLVAASTSGSIACNGGTTTVSVSAAGGTAPYSGDGNYTVGAGTYSYTVTDANGCTSTTSITVTEPTALGASNVASDFNGYGVSCNGGSNGSVNVSATGGTTPYSGDGAYTNLSAGNYSYTVTDANGCTASTSATITEPTVLGASNVTSDFNGYGVSCNGSSNGSVTVSATGGVASYTATGSYNNLSAGNYSYIVTDANGCTASTSATITEPTVLTSASTSGSIACNGGTTTVTVSAAGGTAPYSGDGDYTVGAGTYSYTVTDANGCTSTTSITVTEPTAVETTVGAGQTVFYGYTPMACATISGSATGGTPGYTYSWSSNGTTNGTSTSLTVCPTLSTTYTLTATDILGCTSSADVYICVVDVRCYAGNSNKQKVQMCQIPQGNPANAHTICVDASAVPAHLAIGCVLGACNEQETVCPSNSALRSSVDIEEEKLSSALSVYPNPTSDRTTVSLTVSKAGNYSIVMYDMMGQVVQQIYTGQFAEFENQTFDLNMNTLENGIYMVGITDGSTVIENVKIVKQ